MPSPLVTIGIPFFNGENFLHDALRSVFAQTYEDWELLLVDDGSADRSLEMAMAVRDPRVRVVRNDGNRGLIWTLNRQIELARGVYFARMDHDDLMHPERIARQVALFQANRCLDLAGSAAFTIDGENRPSGIRGEKLARDPANVLRCGLLLHPTVMTRRAWSMANPYDGRYPRAEDHELWCRTCPTASVHHLRQPLLFYREVIPVNLCAYLRAARSEFAIIARYGPTYAGVGQTATLLASRFLKAQAYRLLTGFDLQRKLVERRNRPLTEGERAAAASVIERILATPVPGLG